MNEVTHSLVKALGGVPEFSALGDRELLKIVGASANLYWPAGTRIFEKGTDALALYVVLSGRVLVFDSVGGDKRDVAEMVPGDSMGEYSLILDTTHSLNAEAIEDSELMVLGKEPFEELLASMPNVAAAFHDKVESRQRQVSRSTPT